jgi:hypothetical protein
MSTPAALRCREPSCCLGPYSSETEFNPNVGRTTDITFEEDPVVTKKIRRV